MEVPTPIKESIQLILQSHTTGILVENVFKEYRYQTNLPLPYKQLGFSDLEGLLRAMPDVARLEYSVRDRSMKVYGIQNVNFSMGLPHQYRMGLPHHNRMGGPHHQRMGGPHHNRMESPHHQRMGVPHHNKMGAPYENRRPHYNQDGQGFEPFQSPLKRKLDNTMQSRPVPFNGPAGGEVGPDNRGVYTLCFPSWQKPAELVGTLEDMFSVAGKVFEVFETNRWIYVCYSDFNSTQRAFKMFKHLELKVATDSALKMDREYKQKMQRKKELGIVDPPKPPGWKRRRRGPRLGPCQRVKVGNLDPKIKHSVDFFRKLFGAYKVTWVKFKVVEVGEEEPIMFAYVLAVDRENAEGIAREFNGYMLHGRPLEITVREKKADLQKMTLQEDSSSVEDSSSCTAQDDDEEPLENLQISFSYGSQDNLPGLESAMPGLESAMPGLESAMPGLESATPGLESVLPELEPAIPGLEPALPKLESAMPGLESVSPKLEPTM